MCMCVCVCVCICVCVCPFYYLKLKHRCRDPHICNLLDVVQNKIPSVTEARRLRLEGFEVPLGTQLQSMCRSASVIRQS